MQIVLGGCRGAGLHVSRGTGVQGYIGKEGQPSADSNIKVAGIGRRERTSTVKVKVFICLRCRFDVKVKVLVKVFENESGWLFTISALLDHQHNERQPDQQDF